MNRETLEMTLSSNISNIFSHDRDHAQLKNRRMYCSSFMWFIFNLQRKNNAWNTLKYKHSEIYTGKSVYIMYTDFTSLKLIGLDRKTVCVNFLHMWYTNFNWYKSPWIWKITVGLEWYVLSTHMCNLLELSEQVGIVTYGVYLGHMLQLNCPTNIALPRQCPRPPPCWVMAPLPRAWLA
jgi:hypothetical protein